MKEDGLETKCNLKDSLLSAHNVFIIIIIIIENAASVDLYIGFRKFFITFSA